MISDNDQLVDYYTVNVLCLSLSELLPYDFKKKPFLHRMNILKTLLEKNTKIKTSTSFNHVYVCLPICFS